MPAKMARSSKAHHSAHYIIVPGTPNLRNSLAPAQLKELLWKTGSMKSLKKAQSMHLM